MSGLGNRKNLNSPQIEERYKNVSSVSVSHSILSIGISCFRIDSNHCISNVTYILSVLMGESFLIEPETARFLLRHGLDFNKHFLNSIEYYTGNDRSSRPRIDFIRDLFTEIFKLRTSIVFHNAFIDLIFMYQHFYANLPDTLNKFVADLSDLFAAGGIYDTKYISEFHARENASFLEYLYFKALHDRSITDRLEISFETSRDFHLGRLEVKLDEYKPEDVRALEKQVCKQYSTYGYCNQIKCSKSHLILDVIKVEILVKEKSKLATTKSSEVEKKRAEGDNDDLKIDDHNVSEISHHAHSAGLDSFMTGYVMLSYMIKFADFKQTKATKTRVGDFIRLGDLEEMKKFANNVYLTGKDYPFIVEKSNYSSCSSNHQIKKSKLNL